MARINDYEGEKLSYNQLEHYTNFYHSFDELNTFAKEREIVDKKQLVRNLSAKINKYLQDNFKYNMIRYVYTFELVQGVNDGAILGEALKPLRAKGWAVDVTDHFSTNTKSKHWYWPFSKHKEILLTELDIRAK